MTYWYPPPTPTPEDPTFEFTKVVDIDVDADLNIDATVNLDVDKNIDVYSNVDVEGNAAIAIVDAQAIGTDTLTEVIIVTLAVEDELSMTLVEAGSFVA